MKQYKVIFADLDGTLINTISGETFPKGIWDMKLNFDALDAIKKVNPKYLLIVSNQGGIESGFVDRHNFRAKGEYIARAISEYCNCECYAMYCETNTKTDLYRKPNTGMLENLLESYVGDDFDYIKQKSLMIGDASGKEGQFSDSDKKTAENFGIDYMDVNDFIAELKIKEEQDVKLWIARNQDNSLHIHNVKPSPIYDDYTKQWTYEGDLSMEIDENLYSEVTLENSPQQVELKLVN